MDNVLIQIVTGALVIVIIFLAMIMLDWDVKFVIWWLNRRGYIVIQDSNKE